MDDAELGRRMLEYLRTRGLVDDAQLQRASTAFAAGKLPSTALRLAGVAREAVLGALANASSLNAAPPPARWTADALKLTPIAGVSWQKARAVPIGVVDGRVLVAFADPKRIMGAKGALPPHDAVVCLEEDLEAALHALVDGSTVGADPDATVAGTPPPPIPGTHYSTPHAAKRAEAHAVKGGQLAPQMPSQVGPWHLDQLIAQGGMGVVYLARDDAGRTAAVKLVHAHLLHIADVKTRFLREARANQKLTHKNIVQVLDVGEQDPAWLAVEFVDAGTLAQLIARTGGSLPVAAALDVLVQMLDGLVAAHAQKIVHRDLKPSNLLLMHDGTVKIADFGIARELDATALTQTGSTLGTPAYMSPEQALAEPIDVRSDLYTAGVIVYTLIAGKNPFDAESLGATVAAILKGRVPSLFEIDATVPESVDDLVAALMHRQRDARPSTASDALVVARALFDELRGDRAHPLGDVLADVINAAAINRERASTLVKRAKTLLPQPAQHEAAALVLHQAALLDPAHVEAKKLLDGLRSEGFAFGPASPKLAELEKEVAHKPDDPVLLQRAGQTARQEGNLHKAAAYWRRSLRVRPDDAHLRGQLARLTGTTPSTSTIALSPTMAWPATAALPANAPHGGTVDRIAGHIATGGFQGPAGAPVVGLRPELPSSSSSSVVVPVVDESAGPGFGDLLAAHWGKIAVVLVVAVGIYGVVHAVGKMVEHGKDETESMFHGGGMVHNAKTDADAERSATDQRIADEANVAGDFTAAEKRASEGIERGAKHTVLGRLFLARGKARLGLRKPLAAVEDLSTVIDNFHDDDSAFPDALFRRGMAHAQANDPERAMADFTRVLDTNASPSLLAKARLERGKLKRSKNDPTAKADFEWARDYVSLSDPTHDEAKAELAKLDPSTSSSSD